MIRIAPALKQRSTTAWWREHWLTALPWVVMGAAALAAMLAYAASGAVRDEARALVEVLTSGDQQRIRDYLRGYGAWGPVMSVLLMMAQVVFAPIPASVVQLANGVVYGKVGGGLLNFAGQMAGAMMAFGIAQALGRGSVEKLVGRISEHAFEGWLDRWGSKALFVVRAIPGMPSDFLSYVAGLTTMRPRTYILATAAGYIPQSIVYAWLGDAAMGWFWWIVIGGFVISALIAVAGWAVQRRNVTSRTNEVRAAECA
jgi:uncharacterized membrane protein YdjX (TVP38/TMEM64 family)